MKFSNLGSTSDYYFFCIFSTPLRGGGGGGEKNRNSNFAKIFICDVEEKSESFKTVLVPF